jgi:hypothetical protein
MHAGGGRETVLGRRCASLQLIGAGYGMAEPSVGSGSLTTGPPRIASTDRGEPTWVVVGPVQSWKQLSPDHLEMMRVGLVNKFGTVSLEGVMKSGKRHYCVFNYSTPQSRNAAIALEDKLILTGDCCEPSCNALCRAKVWPWRMHERAADAQILGSPDRHATDFAVETLQASEVGQLTVVVRGTPPESPLSALPSWADPLTCVCSPWQDTF